ncbi:MAG: hypothetical protein JO202_06125 [Ktedonobacteraceae bacterium]|nr:hypothetical protein [Ktedonobacteraceae bacterium]
MPKALREQRERTDNYHFILQWCRTDFTAGEIATTYPRWSISTIARYPRRFETPYRSLQGRLWELDETIWHLAAKHLPDYAPRKQRRRQTTSIQPALLEES